MSSRRLGAVVCTVAVALAVSGCGGGGSDGGHALSVLEKWQRFADGNPTLGMTGAQVSEAWTAAAGRSTHYVALGPESVGRGADPASADPASDDRMDTDVRVEAASCPGVCELERPAEASIWAFAPVLEHDGVPVAEFRSRFTRAETLEPERETNYTETFLVDSLTFGGWLDYTHFNVSVTRWCTVGSPGCAETDDTDDFDPLYAGGGVFGYMAGSYPGTTPAGVGSAAWTGIMVGMEDLASASLRRERPDVFLGDARIAIDDLAAPDVDVSFTNIHNVTEGTRRVDMIWEGLRLEDGLFGRVVRRSGGERYDYLVGMFTGPGHREVGGEFRRDGIAGAFGAKRR